MFQPTCHWKEKSSKRNRSIVGQRDVKCGAGIDAAEDEQLTDPQAAASSSSSRCGRGHRLLLNLFLLLPFPFDCFRVFDPPVCCLEEKRGSSSSHVRKTKSFYNVLVC